MEIWTWPAWAIGAVFGGVGGVIGVILGIAFENVTKIKGSQRVITTICTTVAIGLAVWQIGEHPKPTEPAEAAGGLSDAGVSPEPVSGH